MDNVNAVGSVGGLVLDAETRLPLEGASVAVLAGGQRLDPVVTAADGWFSFASVPAGEILVTIGGIAGYQDAWVHRVIPNNAGEFPTGNAAVTVGPIGLVPVDQALSVRVLDRNGAPVSQYELSMITFAQYLDFSEGTGASAGETLAIAVTDGGGYAQFTAAPDFFRLGAAANDNVVFLLPPLDVDGDGAYEFPGGSQSVSWRAQSDPTPDIVLDADYDTELEVRASTIAGLTAAGAGTAAAAVVERNSSIYVSFNLPIEDTVVVDVTDESGEPLSAAPTISVRDDTLEIGFSAAPLAAGSEYNLHIHATSTVGDRTLTGDFAAAFFTRSDSDAVTAELVRVGTGSTYDVVFSEPVGIAGAINPSLSDANCVLFFDADLSGSGVVGDAANELGNAGCSIALTATEPEPAGIPVRSGYTRFWRFTAPNLATGTPLQADVGVHFLFSHVVDSAFVIERADGRPVPDLTGATAAAIP